MKITLFKKIILLFLVTSSFSSLLQSTPITDLTNDLNATTPDLVQTLKDGITLRNYYISAGQPQLFSKYEAKLEEFFYKNLGMPFDDICDIMEKKKMSAEEVISYVNSNQAPTNNKGSQAMENFYSSTTSAIANNPNFKNTKVVIDTTPTDTSINDNATATLNVIDLSGCFANFYSTIISTKSKNPSLDSWIKSDSELTSDSVKENTVLLGGEIKKFNENQEKTELLLNSLYRTLYNQASPSIIFNGKQDVNDIKEFVINLKDTLKAVVRAVFKGNKSFDSGDGYFEKEQGWFNAHKIGDTSDSGLRNQLLQAIK